MRESRIDTAACEELSEERDGEESGRHEETVETSGEDFVLVVLTATFFLPSIHLIKTRFSSLKGRFCNGYISVFGWDTH